MYSLNSGDVSYIVPMDHVDLKFLRRREPIGDHLKPIWSPRHEEYTEFQLKAWKSDVEQDNNITTMCHVCDTQVPVVYLKEHNNSKKHRNYLKIINETLSRLRNNMNMDFPTISAMQPSKSTYFCEACCLSVQTNSKDIHEETIIHKKSIKNYEAIENFLEVFIKGSTTNSTDVDKNMNGNNNSIAAIQDLKEITNCNNVTGAKMRENNKFETQDSKVTTNSNSAIHTNMNGTEKVETPVEKLKKYINAITHNLTPNYPVIEVLDENYIVVTIKGNTFKLHIDQYNGFVNSEEGEECLLCHNIGISKVEHMWSGAHMRWLMWNLADEHGIRQINQYYSHCIICNELIRSVGGHKTLDSSHSVKLTNARYSTSDDKTGKQSQTLMATTENSKTQTENNKTEENKLKTNEENEVNKNTETQYDHYLISLIEDNAKSVKCKVCDRVIPNFKVNIEDHLNGKSHKKEYNHLLSTNNINIVYKGFACDFCHSFISENFEIDHITSQYHKWTKNGDIKSTTEHTYCEPCMFYIQTHNLESHRKGRKHIEKASELGNDTAKTGSKTYSTVDSTKTYAMVTSNLVENTNVNKSIDTKGEHATAQNLITNNKPQSSDKSIIGQNNTKTTNSKTGTIEMKNVQSLMSSLNINSSTTENKTKLSDVNIQPSPKSTEPKSKVKLHHHLKETSKPNELLCRVCNVLVPNTTNNITSHTNGGYHKINYDNVLAVNKVVQVESNFHCNKCNVPITNKNELDHIFGNRHKSTLSDNDSVSTVSDKNSDQCSNSETKQNQKINVPYQFKESSNPKLLLCRICKVQILNKYESITLHTLGVFHNIKYINLLATNKVVQVDNNFHCIKCDVPISSKNELDHIFGNQHKTNLSADDVSEASDQNSSPEEISDDDVELVTNVYCGFCHGYVSSADYFKHLISSEHVKCVKNISKGALKIYYNQITKKSLLQCRLCDCKINNEFKCAIEHINGSSHKNAYIKFLNVNKICEIGNKMYCLACREYFESDQELLHIWTSANHSGNISVMT